MIQLVLVKLVANPFSHNPSERFSLDVFVPNCTARENHHGMEIVTPDPKSFSETSESDGSLEEVDGNHFMGGDEHYFESWWFLLVVHPYHPLCGKCAVVMG